MKSGFSHFHGHFGQRLSGGFRTLSLGILICLLLLPLFSEARPVRVATYNIENGVGDIGSAEYNAVQAILARMDADVVCFQELQTTSFAAWSNMAVTLGYPYNAIGWDGGSLAGSLYMGFFSRFPILSTYNIQSPSGAKELSRYPYRAVIDVPDAQHPLVIWNMHHKSGAASIDKFRRAIEAYRIVQNIDAYLAANPGNVEYMLVGDLNDDIRDNQTAQYLSQPAGAPDAYVLGTDITFPVIYSKFPTDRYADAGLGMEHMPAYWESTTIPVTRVASGRELDYVFLSPALFDNPLAAPQSELYYSAMDWGGGLPKWGDPLPAETSVTASDHLPTFVDIQMADDSAVEPVDDFVAAGEAGGPFSPVSTFYTATETNQFACTWSVSADVDWLTVVPESFTLAPHSSREVEVFLNSLVESLPPGIYTGSVTFWNETENIVKIRQVTLTIRDPLGVGPADGLSAFGYAGGPFSPASKAYVVTNKSIQPVAFTATTAAPWLTVSPSSRLLQSGDSVGVTVSLNAQANSLSIGTHFASVVFSNQTTGLIQSRPVVLTAAGTLCDAVDRCDLNWTTGGNANWLYQTTDTLDGIDSAQSGTLSSSQQSWMETVVSGPGQVAYFWRVSSQTNTHLLRFMDNGLARDQISGETAWTQRILELSSGVHTLRWAFATASTTPQGINAGWVDQVSIDRFAVSPANDWVASGWAGGPFSPSTRIYTLTNCGLTAISWTATSGVSWITASPASGVLNPGNGTSVTCTLNANANVLTSGNYSGSITFSNQTTGFAIQRSVLLSALGPLCDAVDRCNLVWSTGGTSNWFTQTNTTFDGIDAAQSGHVTTNQSTWLGTTITGPVQLSFQWRVSSGFYDFLKFSVDGVPRAMINGIRNWAPVTYAIPAGAHSVQWSFNNGTNPPGGSNVGWVDQVSLDYLVATPSDIWHPEGYAGGPFSPATQEYILTNSGPAAIQWTASTGSDWIAITPDSGILDPGGFAIAECSLNAKAATKTPSTYSASIIFSNQTTGSSLTRQASLVILDYLIISPASSSQTGFVGGPFSPGSQVFSISNSGPAAYSWRATAYTNWLTLGTSSGTVDSGTASNIVVSINTNAYALSAGLKSARIIFTNTTTRIQQTRGFDLNLAAALAVTFVGGAPSGPVGGPFAPTTTVFTLSNRSRVAQQWSMSPSTNWLTLNAAGGTLPPFSTTQISGTINPSATTLPRGLYPAPVVFSNLTSQTALTPSPYLSVGFVFCEAADACGLTWSFGGNVPWLYQTNVTKDGIDAACSGVITNGQESWAQISFAGSGTLSFWQKVSAAISYDYCQLWIDGSGLYNYTGTTPWQQQTYTFGAGNHDIRWVFYKKTNSPSGTNGNVWIDLISWAPANTAMGVPVEWYQRFGLAPGSSGAWDDLDPLPSAAGQPNWVQYVTGLNPTNPADQFHILTVHQAAGQPTRIDWWGGTNGPSAPYVIQSATNLEHGPWNPTGSIQRAAGLNTWTNTEPADVKRYYRILAQPDP